MTASVGLLQSLQQVQSLLAAMYPNASAPTGASDAATVGSFQQILAALSPAGTTAGGVLGSGQGLTPSQNSDASTTTGPTGADVVAGAEKYLGVRYVLGGESAKGIDCSGLVQKTYQALGITLPRLVHQQKLMGTAVPSLAQAQPGDLIVFKGGHHIAIYEGNNTVIHAPYPGRVVSNQKLWVGDSGIETIRRIVPSAGTAATPTATAAPSSTRTSPAVQAAALSAVRAMIQADFGLLSSPSSAGGSLSTSGASTSSQLQSAISSLGSASGIDASTTSPTGGTTSTASAQQALALEQSMLVQEEL